MFLVCLDHITYIYPLIYILYGDRICEIYVVGVEDPEAEERNRPKGGVSDAKMS
jgi:hypothetical protein